MTNPTPHGQVPEALRLADELERDLCEYPCEAVALVLRRQHAHIAELEAQIEALSEVQALSAAPAEVLGWIYEDELPEHYPYDAMFPHSKVGTVRMFPVFGPQAASPPPPAEQQATKETSGGFHVWRDISTAPKDGSRFVATGHNYGLYSEGRHACVAQWCRGCWIEVSEWNEISELKYLTHWMPLPSPPDVYGTATTTEAVTPEGGATTGAALGAEQAAPKAAPGEVSDTQHSQFLSDVLTAAGLVTHGKQCKALGERLADMVMRLRAAPQQEAQEPYSIDTDPQGIRAIVADAITGALAFGAQGANPPPEGHWLTPFWEMAREEAMRTKPALLSRDTLYLLRRLLSNQHTLTGSEFRAELEKIVGEAYQQEAQEPVAYVHVPHYTVEGKVRPVVSFEKYQQDYADGIYSTRIPLYAAPQPAPAPLSDDVVRDAARYRWLRENWFTMTSNYQRCITFKVGEPRWSDITEEELDAAIDAARKQGDTP